MKRVFFSVCAMAMLAACGGSDGSSDGDDDASFGSTSFGGSSSGTPRLHPIKAVCIDYVSTGQMMNGTSTRCHRKYGYEQYEIQNMTVGMAGFTQEQNQHMITIGDTLYNINVAAGTGTQMDNPVYEQIAEAVDGKDPVEVGLSFMAAMGFNPTDETKSIAGLTCNVHSGQMGSMCVTDDGLMLEQSVMGMTQTATNVDVGNAGSSDNYTLYQNVTITEAPDLSGGLEGLINQFGGQQQ